MLKICLVFWKSEPQLCLVFWKSEPQYAYKPYAYKKNMYLKTKKISVIIPHHCCPSWNLALSVSYLKKHRISHNDDYFQKALEIKKHMDVI